MFYWRAGLLLAYWVVPVLCQDALTDVLQRLEKLESQHKDDKDDIEKMDVKIEHYLLVQSQQIMSQHQEIYGLKEQIASLKHQDQINEEVRGNYVSFTAYATTARTYNAGGHVLFDGIVRNYGSSYFVENSTFVCPFSAYYLFSASFLSGYSKPMYATLMLDDESLLLPHANIASGGRGTATGLTVTYCRTGQIFWIRAHAAGMELYGDNNRHSTISGTLLKLA